LKITDYINITENMILKYSKTYWRNN